MAEITIDLLLRRMASADEERQAVGVELADARRQRQTDADSLAEINTRLERCERTFQMLAQFCEHTMESCIDGGSEKAVFVRFMAGVIALAAPVVIEDICHFMS